MELKPRDIGRERYLKLMRRRMMFPLQHANGAQNGPNGNPLDESPLAPKVQRRTRRLRRYWARGLELDDATSEKLTQAAWKGAPGTTPRVVFTILSIYMVIGAIICLASGGSPAVLAALVIAWSAMAFGLAGSPRPTLRKLHEKALTSGEIEQMLPVARGRLERSYLNLVQDAIQQEIPSVTAQGDIRSALRDLGDTISQLPADPVPSHDPDALRLDADEQRMKAQREPDAFIQGSLLRQAAALDRRATLAGQNASSARRARALRQEAKSQIDALRAVMLAYQHTSPADAETVANLSDAVQRVAQEAQAASVARRELEEDEISMLLGKPLPENLPPQPILPARKIIDPIGSTQPISQPTLPTPEPQVQILQAGRPWWRGQ